MTLRRVPNFQCIPPVELQLLFFASVVHVMNTKPTAAPKAPIKGVRTTRWQLEAGVFIRTTQHAREGLCSEDFRVRIRRRMAYIGTILRELQINQ